LASWRVKGAGGLPAALRAYGTLKPKTAACAISKYPHKLKNQNPKIEGGCHDYKKNIPCKGKGFNEPQQPYPHL
jgi:hypothetical protein